MPLVTVGDETVLAMELHRPRVGAWHAIIDLGGDTAPTGRVTINIAGGAQTFVGTAEVYRSGEFADRVRIRVVGGAGGLSSDVAPRMFRRVTMRTPVVDVLTTAGETLSPTSDAAFLAKPLPRWVRLRSEVGQALDSMAAKVPGTAWRVLPDGTVWFGPETWPAAAIDYALVDEDPSDRRIVIATEDASLSPGTTLDGRRIDEVVLRFEPERVRVEAWLAL